MQNKIHEGRNMKRFKEMPGIRQKAQEENEKLYEYLLKKRDEKIQKLEKLLE